MDDDDEDVSIDSREEDDEVGTGGVVSKTCAGGSTPDTPSSADPTLHPRFSVVVTATTLSPSPTAAGVLAVFNFLIASLAFRGPASAINGFRKG